MQHRLEFSRVLSILALCCAGLVALLLNAGVLVNGDDRVTVANSMLAVCGLMATGSCLRTWRRFNGSRAWLFFGAACGAWSIGQLIWIWISEIQHQVPSYPSVADVGYLLFAPTFAIGMGLLIRHTLQGLTAAELMLDSLVTSSMVGYAAFVVVFHPVSNSGESFAIGPLVSVVWQAGAVALLAFASIVLLVRLDLIGRNSTLMLIAGLLSYASASAIYGRQALDDRYEVGTWLDLGWNWGFLLIAGAAVAARDLPRNTFESSLRSEQRIVFLRAGMMAISVLAFTVLTTRTALYDAEIRSIAIGTAIAGIVLALRLGYAGVQAARLRMRTRERDRMTGVVATADVIGNSLDLDEILPRLAQAAAAAVGRERAEVYIFAADGSRVEAFVQYGYSDEERAQVRDLPEEGIGLFVAEAEAICTMRPVIQRLTDGGIPDEYVPAFTRIGKRYSLVTPLLAGTEVVGIFDIWTPFDERHFMQEDIEAVAAIGKQAGRAVEHSRTLMVERRRTQEQQALRSVIAAGVSADDLTTTLHAMVQASLGLGGAEACSVEIWHPDENATELAAEAAVDAWPDTEPDGARYSLDDWQITRRALTERVTLNLLADDPQLTPTERASFKEAGTEAALVIPLIVADVCLGVLNLFRHSPERFNRADVRIGQELAAHMALAIDRARLLADERRRADEQEAMRRIVQTFIANDNLQEMLQATLDATLGVARAEFASIELIDPGADFTYAVAAAYLEIRPTDQHLPHGKQYQLNEWQSTARVLNERRTLTGLATDPIFSEFESTYLQESGIGCIVMAPLLIGSTPIGVLNLSTREAECFTADEIRRVEEVATQIALAIERSRLMADERRRAKEQEALRSILQAIVSSNDLSTMLHETTEAVLGLASMEFCSIELWYPDRGEVEVKAHAYAADWDAYDSDGSIFTVDERWPAFSRALHSRQMVHGLVRDPIFSAYERAHFEALGTRTFVITPVVIGDRVMGLLNVASRLERRLSEHEQELMKEVAAEVALAIDRAQLLDALRERADTDGLTGVRNHRAILETLDLEIARTRRTNTPLTMMMIDLDGFKGVNDTWGHQAGDDVLRRVASFLCENLREVDRVGRYGGDEFLLVMPGLDSAGAHLVVERLLERAKDEVIVLWSAASEKDKAPQGLAALGPLGRPALPTTPMRLSIGVATLPDDALQRADLLVTADARMYEAKMARRERDAARGILSVDSRLSR